MLCVWYVHIAIKLLLHIPFHLLTTPFSLNYIDPDLAVHVIEVSVSTAWMKKEYGNFFYLPCYTGSHTGFFTRGCGDFVEPQKKKQFSHTKM